MKSYFDIQLGYTRQRLQLWSYWNDSNTTIGLNYRSKSIEAKLIESKGEIIPSTAGMPELKNDEAEEINDWINEYGTVSIERARLLVSHYASDDSLKNKIQKSRLSRATYFRYLNEAENWIKEKLYPVKIISYK